MREYKEGERVYVHYEGSNGTVVRDNGFGKNWDGGVDVKVDSDGMVLSAAHDQLYPPIDLGRKECE